MIQFVYVALLSVSFAFGWYEGLAGYQYTRWVAAPIFTCMLGMMVRYFWGKP